MAGDAKRFLVQNTVKAEKVLQQMELTVSQGARLVCGGSLEGKTYFAPTILDDVTPEMDIAKDMECFGPVMPVIGFDAE